MKNTFFAFLILALMQPAFVFSQNQNSYSINWYEQAKKLYIKGNQVNIPTFEKAVFVEVNEALPSYHLSLETNAFGIESVEIKNAVFSLYEFDLNDQQKALIGNKIEPNFKIETARNKRKASVDFIPLRINSNNQIEKLVRFDLVLNENFLNNQARLMQRTYAEQSKLANGTFFRIETAEEGVYKLDKAFFEANGIDVNFSLDQVKMFGYPSGKLPEANNIENFDDLVENPIEIIDANNNNSLDDQDAIIFYGAGVDDWKLNASGQFYDFTKNPYSTTKSYFLQVDGNSGKRVQTDNTNATPTYTTNTFDWLYVHEEELENLTESGRAWYGERFEFITEHEFNFQIPNFSNGDIYLQSLAVARSTNSSTSMDMFLNNNPINTEVYSAVSSNYLGKRVDHPEWKRFTTSVNSNQINLKYKYNQSSSADQAWLDKFIIEAKSNLSFNNANAQFIIRDKNSIGNVTRFQLNAFANNSIWDVTDVSNIKKINVQNNAFIADANGFKKFVAFGNNSFLQANSINPVANQNLHSNENFDYLIISHPLFLSEIERLANFHRANGLSVLVTNVLEVYNEFSSGDQDITAIRNFIRMFYDKANGDENLMPKHVLLVGDASYDFKGIHFNDEDNTNLLPSYQSYNSYDPVSTYCSDDYFIDKVEQYKISDSFGDWRNDITFIADDEDSNIHFDDAESHTLNIASNHPEMNIDKIYLDAFDQISTTGGARYPEVNEAINRKLFTGTFAINYIGHGGENGWSQERILSFNDIETWNNENALPLFITATCSFSRFDNPIKHSAGEEVVIKENGGAISIVTTTRVVYASANEELNSSFLDHFFKRKNGNYPGIGEMLVEGKNISSTGINNRKFSLLGDPALVMNYPEYNVQTTSITNTLTGENIDTINALSTVTITGKVVDDNGNILSDFNGIVTPTIFDKEISIKTKGNDGLDWVENFKLRKNIVFKGNASVTNGEFSFDFIVPKDISFNYDNAKISYYANDEVAKDANGYDFDVTIGGINENAPEDNTAPEVNVYLNNSDFVNGGITNQSPILYVELYDESGINTVGTGIGHDIIAVVDGDEKNAIVLNTFYQSNLDDFTRGKIRYPFSDLSEGKHSIKITAWDVHNNWSEGFVEFEVRKSNDALITNVFNYPNPFTTNTEFHFEHNQFAPDLKTIVTIYTLTGKKVKTIEGLLPQNSFRASNITWDGKDDFGQNIARGTYLYQISLVNNEIKISSDLQKLVILK